MKKLGLIFFLCLSSAVQANSMGSVVAKVTGTGTYGDGSIYIFFDRQISSCNTSGRIDIPENHPAKAQILSIAMTAFASGKSIKIRPSACGSGKPVFEAGTGSYIYLTN